MTPVSSCLGRHLPELLLGNRASLRLRFRRPVPGSIAWRDVDRHLRCVGFGVMRRGAALAALLVVGLVVGNADGASRTRDAWAAAADRVCARTLRVPVLQPRATIAQTLGAFRVTVRSYARTLALHAGIRDPLTPADKRAFDLERPVLDVHRAMVADLRRLRAAPQTVLRDVPRSFLKTSRLSRDVARCRTICTQRRRAFRRIGAFRCARGAR